MKKQVIGFACLLAALSLFAAGCRSSQPEEKGSVSVNVPASSTLAEKKDECLRYTDLTFARKSPTAVCVLDVSGQDLTGALPAEIRQLSNLKLLDAHRNKMTGIPAEIGQLSHLQSVNFSFNQLDTMPDEIANLRFLESMSLAENKYRTLPDSVLHLTQMRKLDLMGNPMSAEEIARIRKAMPNTEVVF